MPDSLIATAEPGPEARFDAQESVALSFIAGLQHLPVQQRTVLVLRDVLGLPAAEVAEILDTTPTSVNSTLIRARSGFRPDRSPDAVPQPRSRQEAAVVDRFVRAFQAGDARRVAAVLSDDAHLSMPPEPIQCNGADAVGSYLRARGFWGSGLRLVATRANGQPAYGYYFPDPGGGAPPLNGLVVLTLASDRVTAVTRFGAPIVGDRFGLPAHLSPEGGLSSSVDPSTRPRSGGPSTR